MNGAPTARRTAIAVTHRRRTARVALIAGKVLAGVKPTMREAKILAASVLTQALDKRKA